MKILALTARLPWPLDTGAKIRSFHVLKILAQAHEMTVVSFISNFEEYGHLSHLKKFGIDVVPVFNQSLDHRISFLDIVRGVLSPYPFSVPRYRTGMFEQTLRKQLAEKQFDLLHCEHLHMAQYVPPSLAILKTLDAHNVESEIVKRWCEKETNSIRKVALHWHLARMKRYEKKNVRMFDLVMAVSDRDRDMLVEMGGRNNVEIIENGVDVAHYYCKTKSVSRDLVFVGSMDWQPNDDGIRFFVFQIFPLILQRDKRIRLFVVGRKPSKALIEAAQRNPNVIVTGAVEDVRPYIESASVAVVPLRVGGGTRLKVLEAFSMAKAVVSTSLGSEGIQYTHGEDILIAEDPLGFADAVMRLLDDRELNNRIGTKARALVEAQYSWTNIEKKVVASLEKVLPSSRRKEL